MRTKQVSLAVWLLLATLSAGAEPAVKLPAEVHTRPGRLTLIRAETDGKVLRWVSLSEDADVLPYLDQQAIFSAPSPGRYRVLCYTAAGDVPSQPATCAVVVETPPPPPGPNPGPNPTPGPQPADPFAQALQAAYAGEADANKASQVKLLAALYRNAMTSTVSDPGLKTLGDLYGVLRKAAASLIPEGALPRVRRAVADELDRALGTTQGAPLDDATRKKCVEEFGKVAASLEGLR